MNYKIIVPELTDITTLCKNGLTFVGVLLHGHNIEEIP